MKSEEGHTLKRRNLLRSILLFIFAFIFGYTIKKEGENIVFESVDSSMTNRKDGKLVADEIKALKGQLAEKGLQISTIRKSKLYATDFGIVGDGKTDDTKAIDNLINTALTYKLHDTKLNNNYMGTIEILFPAGRFVYRGKNLFYAATNRTAGLKISGSGRYVTSFLYKPLTKGNYMFYNNDKLLGLTFEDMSFYGNIDNSFMLSNSSGGAQNYIFNRVTWNNWDKVIDLKGDNTNSEMTWYSCNFNGTIKKGLYSGIKNTSDQFLNYNFFACNYEVQEGDFIDMSKGGNINIYGGSFIHIGKNGGTFFKLNNNIHARSVQRFICSGGRFEHRVPNSKLLDCSWGGGNVNFLSCSTTANEDGSMDKSTRVVFRPGNTGMPIIKFDGCTLGGVHEYWYSINSFSNPQSVVYDSCHLWTVKEGKTYSDFIKYIDDSSYPNSGSKPRIRFINCKNEDWRQLSDSDYGFESTNIGLTNKKIVSVKNSRGEMVNRLDSKTEGIESIVLPIGAIITKILVFTPANAVTSGNTVKWTIETQEAKPTVLAIVSGIYKDGINFSKELFHICDTEDKRNIRVRASTEVDQNNKKGFILIEYIG
ncbi:hypothetical protein [Peribacillus asahii]|uniref:hypothetical protein n=1 Tax=Peribacillus asahii TaxID=228899 RepID=UPI0037F89B20